MSLDPLTAVLDAATTVIDKIFPDANQANEAKAELLKLSTSGQIQIDLGQMEINKIEAASDNLFKSGWRPAVGWTCVAGFIYAAIMQPILAWAALIYSLPPLPIPDTGIMMSTLGAILGIGGLRTYEKQIGKIK